MPRPETPIAGATVTAVSPSQRASATTDNAGHFVFLALNPDTYTVSVAKGGYQDVSQAGATVFADQVSTQNFRMRAALRTIANVTSRAAGNLVKPGVTADIYSVNAATAAAAAPLGGGGNLDSAYSAMSSVPGLNVPIGGTGWNNNTAPYIHGQNYYFTAFEYDGIPVNRAFDNYNSSTESNLGLQELQVYTGGGPASISSAGTSGFVNQVIKTGTYPGFGTLNGTLAVPQYYHEARVEAGGASPNRNFELLRGPQRLQPGLQLYRQQQCRIVASAGRRIRLLRTVRSTPQPEQRNRARSVADLHGAGQLNLPRCGHAAVAHQSGMLQLQPGCRVVR